MGSRLLGALARPVSHELVQTRIGADKHVADRGAVGRPRGVRAVLRLLRLHVHASLERRARAACERADDGRSVHSPLVRAGLRRRVLQGYEQPHDEGLWPRHVHRRDRGRRGADEESMAADRRCRRGHQLGGRHRVSHRVLGEDVPVWHAAPEARLLRLQGHRPQVRGEERRGQRHDRKQRPGAGARRLSGPPPPCPAGGGHGHADGLRQMPGGPPRSA
mmetsp:Transcript_101508/g.293757  ORF Transcript_101508/g.293757 Transcript_101508/m.293757 type:complete len:219 (-) Transcript_101508:25-681(-)